jgi:hypothetical protein
MRNEAWCELEGEIEDAVWNRYRKEFSFKPSVTPADWPSIIEPTPSVTYSIATLYDQEHFWEFVGEIHQKALTAFRNRVLPEQKLYVLDWQHPCYSFNAHFAFNAEQFDEWRIPVFPDGDYYIFLAEDFTFGTFGHPWEQTICVFGQALIDAFECNCPSAFQIIRRK